MEEKDQRPFRVTVEEQYETPAATPPAPPQPTPEEAPKPEEPIKPAYVPPVFIKEEPKPRPILLPLILVFLAGVLLGAAIVGGVYNYKSRVEKLSPTPESQALYPENQPETTLATPTPSAEPTLSLDNYKISLLNGSGIVGEANKVKALLTSAGFKNITTGNAQSYSFTVTEISTKESVPQAVVAKIQSSLTGYKSANSETLSASDTYDIQIVIGKSKS